MKPKRHRSSSRDKTPVIKVRRAPGTPTKAQLKAAAKAETRALRGRWRSVQAEARSVWAKLQPEELARTDGNFHMLAGLVQMRYQLSRQESDRQVSAFLAQYCAPPPAPAAAAPSAVVQQA